VEAEPSFLGSAQAERLFPAPTDGPADDHSRIAARDPAGLLHALALLDFSPTALAQELDVSPFALLQWLESEEVQHELARYHAIERQMLALRACKSRRLTIDSLEHVLETTDDLVEKRRTATTLLRLLSRPLCEGERTTKRRSDASPASEPHPAEPGSVSDRGTPAAPQPLDSHLAPEAQSLEKHEAQPSFYGSAQAEPRSESELKNPSDHALRNKSARAHMTAPAPERDEEPSDQSIQLCTEPDWDAFFPEAFTTSEPKAPTPHQRE